MNLKMPKSIEDVDISDIGDNLLYYKYSIKNLLSLEKKGVDKESPNYLSAYNSFAGSVYENYLYEKLLIYAKQNSNIGNFILKGPHAVKIGSASNSLHIDRNAQIIYKTKNIEINEFDALFFNEKEIIFVEMTLIKSVTNLKRRLRKKKALLETLFPKHEIKALIILTKGVVGSKKLPNYCTVWITKQLDVYDIYEKLKHGLKKDRAPFIKQIAPNLLAVDKLTIAPFRYYNSLAWMLYQLRSSETSILNMDFFNTKIATRYMDLFTKVYIGYMDKNDFQSMYPYIKDVTEKVVVSIEKEHTGKHILMYFMQYSRNKLLNVVIKNDTANIVKKDARGISVTEVYHILHLIKPSHKINSQEIKEINKLLKNMV